MKRLLSPFHSFVQSESSSGIVLLVMAVVAFIWANSGAADLYEAMKSAPFGLRFGDWQLEKASILWVNDALMAIFFLYVGLEIKREMLVGELSNRKAALLPMFAAVGGMVVPALLYVLVNRDGGDLTGWGIPMATDIAFALGIMALLGSRVPLALKVFLTALAIVDDLGAVLVIALFYTAEVKGQALLFSLAALALAAGYNWLGGRRIPVYLLIGVFAWYFMLKSGVHATVAGVLLALAVPLERKIEPRQLVDEIRYRFGTGDEPKPFEEGEVAVEEVEEVVRQAHSPLHDLEHGLAPWVAFLIMPLFALFNAGFQLSPEASLGAPVALGAFLGLLVGKPIGVLLFAWLAVRIGLSALPQGVNWMALTGAGALAGVGFTMSLFIAALGFGDGALLDQAKLGVLSASVVAGLLGLGLLAWGTRGERADQTNSQPR